MIAPGQRADLILFNTDRPHWIPRHDLEANIVYAAHPSDITHVLCDGRWLLHDGAMTTLDEERIRREAEQRAFRMVGTPMRQMRAYRGFIREVFPLILQQNPDVSLTIIGKSPPEDLVKLASAYPQKVTLTGYVPDLKPYMRESGLIVIPLRAGSGMRLRILEALAQGMPLVTHNRVGGD